MTSNRNSPSAFKLASLAAESAQKYSAAEQSEIVQKARRADRDFAEEILAVAGEAKSVEDLVELEKTLQKLDHLKAKSGHDKKSILASQKSYEQFTITLGQMKKNPDAYFTANMGHKESGGDPKAIVRGNSLDFIEGNVTRMRNREGFAPDGEREVWAARIAVAKRTGDLFRDMHAGLVANFEETQ